MLSYSYYPLKCPGCDFLEIFGFNVRSQNYLLRLNDQIEGEIQSVDISRMREKRQRNQQFY